MLQTQITNTNSREMFVLLLQDLVFISHNERTDHEESFQIKGSTFADRITMYMYGHVNDRNGIFL